MPAPVVEVKSCPALAVPAGPTQQVTPAQADELPEMLRSAAPGTQFLLADGTYLFSGSDEGARRLQLAVPGVGLRGASGDAAKVVLDGGYHTSELVSITAAHVTVAHLTLTRARDHLVHITGPAQKPRLYGLRLIDAGEQFVKVNPDGEGQHVHDGEIACSHFELTDAGRPRIEREPGGCYTGGIDAHGAQRWVIRDSVFRGIYCAGEGLAEHAVHFWRGSRDTRVVNNRIYDCARGVGFGLVESSEGPFGHVGGVIAGNLIWADTKWFDTGIELSQAQGARVHHNTVLHGKHALRAHASIDARFAKTDARIRNNLVKRISRRDGAQPRLEGNRDSVPLRWFADAEALDFRLTREALEVIDRGVALEQPGRDLSGAQRPIGKGLDPGAFEYRP